MLESRNFIDGMDFTRNDPCVFVTYPAGASGDLLISIIDKHYIRTGCEYYGIADNGRIRMFTTDYEMMDLHRMYEFTDQWFYDLASKLGDRNLNYSLLDQVIFGCHMHTNAQHQYILDTFPNAKIINISPTNGHGYQLIEFLRLFKLHDTIDNIDKIEIPTYIPPTLKHERILNLPFGALFNKEQYYKYYDQVIDFLNLNGRLICFDYIKYYLSKQHPTIQTKLTNHSKLL